MRTAPSFLAWLALGGGLLLVMALSSAHRRRLPVSSAAIYLLFGLAISPLGLGWLSLDARQESVWLERVTELATILSLFVGGLKLREPLRSGAWWPPLLLAGPVMLISIVCVALVGYLLGLPGPSALLLGAVLAPTDPVLASAVSVNTAADKDRLRYALSGEAGLNDGMAFPFVIFALMWSEQPDIGSWVGGWLLHRLLWAVPAGLLTGFLLGRTIGKLAVKLRSAHADTQAPTDFLALSLIALTYVCAESIAAWGFLSVFAAGVGLRSAELAVVKETPHPEAQIDGANSGHEHPPAEELIPGNVTEECVKEPAVAAGVLVSETISFGDIAERLLEVALVVIVGLALAQSWTLRALPLAAACFLLIRPLAVRLCLRRTETSSTQRWLLGWFGVRGIGSLYYLSYALHHGLRGAVAERVVDLSVSVVAISIVIHGVTARPLLDRYERQQSAG